MGDTVPDMVLVDMEVTVLDLPTMEVTDLDTVSGRDLLMLMPGTDVATVDTDTVVVHMDTESKFYLSINLLPFILISSHHTQMKQNVIQFHQNKTNYLSECFIKS